MQAQPNWFTAFDLAPAESRPELLAQPVVAAMETFPRERATAILAAPIDPTLSDTAAFCAHYGVPGAASANCVIVAGKRNGEERFAAVVILATTRADINGTARRQLDVRKISFAPMDTATGMTGMEYGGITPIGLPAGWPILLDRAVAQAGPVVIGSGLRTAKIVIDGAVLGALPGAVILDGLAH